MQKDCQLAGEQDMEALEGSVDKREVGYNSQIGSGVQYYSALRSTEIF